MHDTVIHAGIYSQYHKVSHA